MSARNFVLNLALISLSATKKTFMEYNATTCKTYIYMYLFIPIRTHDTMEVISK